MKPLGKTLENPKGEKRKNEGLKKKSARLSPCAPIDYLVLSEVVLILRKHSLTRKSLPFGKVQASLTLHSLNHDFLTVYDVETLLESLDLLTSYVEDCLSCWLLLN